MERGGYELMLWRATAVTNAAELAGKRRRVRYSFAAE
jgi:hypothetical protein